MSFTETDDNEHDGTSSDSPWRRSLQRLKKLSPITSKGNVYLFDQFRERVPMRVRNRAIAMLSEFVGTFMFMFIGIGGNSTVMNDAAMKLQWGDGSPAADPAKILFIATVWGAAVTVNAWAFFRISGGLFNPAVTMAMMIIQAVPVIDGLLDIISQFAGSVLACGICYALLPPGSLAATELGKQTTVTQGLFIEMFLTAQLVLAVFMLATEKHKATFIAPVGIGIAVFACILMGATYSGASMNPLRSFAVCIVTGKFTYYHWIYWVGPGLGALLATGFYLLIRQLEYWTVNPDVDSYESMVGNHVSDVKERIN